MGDIPKEEDETTTMTMGKNIVSRKPYNASTNSTTTMMKKKNSIHPPASCAPVCSDPTSFKSSGASLSSNSVNLEELADEEIANLVLNNKVKDHELEKRLDPFRAVTVRR